MTMSKSYSLLKNIINMFFCWPWYCAFSAAVLSFQPSKELRFGKVNFTSAVRQKKSKMGFR